MARGWESKSVDDLQAAAEAAAAERQRPALSPEERTREEERARLHLARTRTIQDLQSACDRRYRALLEQTLAHLDAELLRLGDQT
jgi:hypothetical protein